MNGNSVEIYLCLKIDSECIIKKGIIALMQIMKVNYHL